MFQKRPITKYSQRRLVHGVGINDAPYLVAYTDADGKRITCPFYQKWTALLQRCYSTAYQKTRPTYVGCTVEESWKTFSNFHAWMQNQDWQGKALDKDLLDKTSKHYGPDNCLFISPALNNLLCLHDAARGEYPLGVCFPTTKGNKRFLASISRFGKTTILGSFASINEAAEAYRIAKLSYISELAELETDPRVKQALLNLY